MGTINFSEKQDTMDLAQPFPNIVRRSFVLGSGEIEDSPTSLVLLWKPTQAMPEYSTISINAVNTEGVDAGGSVAIYFVASNGLALPAVGGLVTENTGAITSGHDKTILNSGNTYDEPPVIRSNSAILAHRTILTQAQTGPAHMLIRITLFGR